MSSQLVKNFRPSFSIYSIIEETINYLKSNWSSILKSPIRLDSIEEHNSSVDHKELNESEVFYEEQAFYTLFKDDDSFQKAYGHSDNPLTN